MIYIDIKFAVIRHALINYFTILKHKLYKSFWNSVDKIKLILIAGHPNEIYSVGNMFVFFNLCQEIHLFFVSNNKPSLNFPFEQVVVWGNLIFFLIK